LLNDKLLEKLKWLPASARFCGLGSSPVLRSRAGEIDALAFFKISSAELPESEIDSVLDDWRSARSSITASVLDLLGRPLDRPDFFAAWSAPVWLRQFEQVEPEGSARSSNPVETQGISFKKIGRLEYTFDFKLIRLGGQYFDLRSRLSARFCIKYLVEKRAFSESAARSLLDEIDPYVREQTRLPKAVAVKMTDYFANERGLKLQELRRLLVCPAGRNGRYFLNVE
jgi:hypothetical protein